MRPFSKFASVVLAVLVAGAGCVAPTEGSTDEASSTDQSLVGFSDRGFSELPPIPYATRALLTEVGARLPYQSGAEDIGIFFPTRFHVHVPVTTACGAVDAPSSTGRFNGTLVLSADTENLCFYEWSGTSHAHPQGTPANLGDFAPLRALVRRDADIRPVRSASRTGAVIPAVPNVREVVNSFIADPVEWFVARIPKCGKCWPGLIATFDPNAARLPAQVFLMTANGPSARALDFYPGDSELLSFDTSSPAFQSAFGVVNPATATFVIKSYSPRRVMPSVELDTDYPGNDFPFLAGYIHTTKPLECIQACEANADCKAYTFTTVAVHGAAAGCWLKNAWRTNGVSTRVTKAGMISGTKP
jgi:hypothetical protein